MRVEAVLRTEIGGVVVVVVVVGMVVAVVVVVFLGHGWVDGMSRAGRQEPSDLSLFYSMVSRRQCFLTPQDAVHRNLRSINTSPTPKGPLAGVSWVGWNETTIYSLTAVLAFVVGVPSAE